MVRGLYTAYTGMINQQKRLDTVTNNLANATTTGFKREGVTSKSFDQMLTYKLKDLSVPYLAEGIGSMSLGVKIGENYTDYSQGSIQVTSNPFDIAINGQGYIPVFSKTGEVAYTRDGALKQGVDGYLVTSDDWIVGNGIKIPSNCYKFTIEGNGDVYAYEKAQAKGKKIGNIPLVRFANPEGLEQTDMNKMRPTEESGEAVLVKDHTCIVQNNLENSNVKIMDSVSDMLRLNASMLASTRMMKVVDDMYNKSINIRE